MDGLLEEMERNDFEIKGCSVSELSCTRIVERIVLSNEKCEKDISSEDSVVDNEKCTVSERLEISKNRVEHSKLVKGKKRGPKIKKQPEKTYPCQLCTYVSTRRHDLKRHFFNIHKDKPHICTLKEDSDDEDIDECEEENGESFIEQECHEDMSKKERSRIEHSTIVRGQKRGPKMKYIYEKTYPCAMCTYVSTRKFDLKRHVSTVHKKEKPYVCNVCKYSTGLAETLKQHMLRVHNESKFKCASCNFSCPNRGDYLHHLMVKHGYMPYSCDSCQFSCVTRNEMKLHTSSVHTDFKPYHCSQCNYKTSQRGNLSKHVTFVHSKSKIFKCNLCNFSTTNGKYNLIRHVKLKHDQKPRPTDCDMCGYIDARERAVYDPEHMHACEFCPYSTSNRGNLNKHVAYLHTKTRIFSCRLCTFASPRKWNFKNHLRIKHTKTKGEIEKIISMAAKQDIIDKDNPPKEITAFPDENKSHNEAKEKTKLNEDHLREGSHFLLGQELPNKNVNIQ